VATLWEGAGRSFEKLTIYFHSTCVTNGYKEGTTRIVGKTDRTNKQVVIVN
jgi:hypothetical protein